MGDTTKAKHFIAQHSEHTGEYGLPEEEESHKLVQAKQLIGSKDTHNVDL